MSKRRSYKIAPIIINGRSYWRVIVDPHYENKHSEHINDELILKLVLSLDDREQLPEIVDDGFSYFVTMVKLNSKSYRLIWMLEDDAVYIGVINAFRDRKERV